MDRPPQGDLAEITAIDTVFAGRRRDAAGHLGQGRHRPHGAAAGVMNVLAALHGMEHCCLVPTTRTTEPEPSATFRVVLDRPFEATLETVQLNAFGFGGQDASLVLTHR